MADNTMVYLGTLGSENKLSDAGKEFERELKKYSRVTRLSSGAIKEDIISFKQRFIFKWQWLAHTTASVVDGGLGRNELKALYDSGNNYSFKVLKQDGSFESFTVRFSSYQEKVLDRSNENWYYDISVELEEV